MEVRQEPKPRRHATSAEVVKIHNLMQQHLIPGANGCVSFAPGWSDYRIAVETGALKASIQKVRKENFGRLYQKDVEQPSMFVNTVQLEALENRVAALDKQMSHLYARLGVTLPV